MYVAVKGGEAAILASLEQVDAARRGDRALAAISVAQIREQMRLNHKVCIIVPTNRDLYGVAKRLGERGVPVEKATPPRGGGPPAGWRVGGVGGV